MALPTAEMFCSVLFCCEDIAHRIVEARTDENNQLGIRMTLASNQNRETKHACNPAPSLQATENTVT
jgi:hypothetical protein